MTAAYISLDVLIGWTRAEVPSLGGALGRPLSAAVRSGPTTFTAVRYPFAILFVELLRSMMDRVVVYSDVEPSTTKRMLRATQLGALPYVAIQRGLSGRFSLESLGLAPVDVPHALIVCPSAAEWDPEDASRILLCRVGERYTDEKGHVRPHALRHTANDTAIPLLEALSVVIRVAESRRALPDQSVAQVMMYRRQHLLSQMRFYIPSIGMHAMELARQLDAHGAVMTSDPRNSTHIILPTDDDVSDSEDDGEGDAAEYGHLREALVRGNAVRCTSKGVMQACAYLLTSLLRKELKPHALLAAMFLPHPDAGPLPREALHRIWEHANLPLADEAMWAEIAEELRGVATRVPMGLLPIAHRPTGSHVAATECVCAVLGLRSSPTQPAAVPPTSPTETNAAHDPPPLIPQGEPRRGERRSVGGDPRRSAPPPPPKRRRRSESPSSDSDGHRGGSGGRRRTSRHTRRERRATPPPPRRRSSPRSSGRRVSPRFELETEEAEAFVAVGIPQAALETDVDAIDQYCISELTVPSMNKHKLAILTATARYREYLERK